MARSVSRATAAGRTADSWQFVLAPATTARANDGSCAAQAALDAALADQARGQLAGPGRRTLEQYLTSWLETVQMTLAPSSHSPYRTVARRYVVPRLGAVQLSALAPLTLSLLYADLSRAGGLQRTIVAVATLRRCRRRAPLELRHPAAAVVWSSRHYTLLTVGGGGGHR